MQNIIFLDVDGVLNSINNLITVYKKTNKPHSGYSYPFDYKCLEYLKIIVLKTNSYIVISSSWRKSKEGMDKLIKVLNEYDLDKYVIGITPNLGLSKKDEIKNFLLNYKDNLNFIILDDCNDMDELSNNLIQTNPLTGLTFENVEQALNLLNKNKIKRLL